MPSSTSLSFCPTTERHPAYVSWKSQETHTVQLSNYSHNPDINCHPVNPETNVHAQRELSGNPSKFNSDKLSQYERFQVGGSTSARRLSYCHLQPRSDWPTVPLPSPSFGNTIANFQHNNNNSPQVKPHIAPTLTQILNNPFWMRSHHCNAILLLIYAPSLHPS